MTRNNAYMEKKFYLRNNTEISRDKIPACISQIYGNDVVCIERCAAKNNCGFHASRFNKYIC